MKISDLMTTDVATCSVTDSLNRAAQIMWERRCGSVPVVDPSQRVVGMVTDRDVCMAAYTQGRRLDDIAVTSVMSRPVMVCPGAATAEEAESLMMAYGVHRLVVVDTDGRLSGVVSLDDIARQAAIWDGKGDVDLERVAVTLGEISRRTSTWPPGVRGHAVQVVTLGEISRRTSTGEEDAPGEAETDLSDALQNSLEALKALRDEIRSDLKLASQKTRDRWRHLEARLHAAEIRVQEKRRGGARHLAKLVENARRFGSRLKQPRGSTRAN